MTAGIAAPLYAYQRCADQDTADAHHPVVIVGAGPVGLALGLDLAQRDVPVVIVDDNDRPGTGSRAICFAKRTLEIFDRLGCGERMVEAGVTWNLGKVFRGDDRLYSFDLLAEPEHARPAFINLQQYRVEQMLIERLRELQGEGRRIELRGASEVRQVAHGNDHVVLTVDTPDGHYSMRCDWLVACDGARSPVRSMLGLEFVGRVFEDNFLIADVTMHAPFPTERWFWFDPPFNRGQSALLHKQPGGVWRIDLQLGRDIDRDAEGDPARIRPRIEAMLGDGVDFELVWTSIYTFQCRRMERFRDRRVFFAGDAAHQVSPFGARGANSGVQDADNLGWKLAEVMHGRAPASLLDSYEAERIPAADENIGHSTRATDFISPKSAISRLFRDATLDLAGAAPFARALVNSGRLSTPTTYDGSPLNGPDDDSLPARTRPGAPAVDAGLGNDWLLAKLDGAFTLLGLGDQAEPAARVPCPAGTALRCLPLATPLTSALTARYLGDAAGAVYLLRPDQHVTARWRHCDAGAITAAIATANASGGVV